MSEFKVENDNDIFGEVEESVSIQPQRPNPLYILPEGVEWFVPNLEFGKPTKKEATTETAIVRFLSWKISVPESYNLTGTTQQGVLRNMLPVLFHRIPDNYGNYLVQRVPCRSMFGEACPWCAAKIAADRRLPRDKQPEGYFRECISPLKPKEKLLMMGIVYKNDGGGWKPDSSIRAFEFSTFVRNGRALREIIDARANDADKRLRIDKKSYAGYVDPVAIKLSYSWPTKDGVVERGRYSAWAVVDATPFPVEAGGPNVAVVDKEWAVNVAKNDPAAWVTHDDGGVDPKHVNEWLYGVFTGQIQIAPTVNYDTATFGELLEVVNINKDKFSTLNLADFDYTMTEPLREIVKGVLNG